jgi:PAS domain S-box-containing protein
MGTGLTGIERKLGRDEIIVSKTDLKGKILYCNDVFKRIGGYSEPELIGQPHNMIRHPAMPRCVFKLLWDTIEAGTEIFAYVKNRAKNGDHYWVFAHVTPDLDATGKVIGFNSFRRSVEPTALAVIEPLYADLLAEENCHGDRKTGLKAATEKLQMILASKGLSYDQFVLGL